MEFGRIESFHIFEPTEPKRRRKPLPERAERLKTRLAGRAWRRKWASYFVPLTAYDKPLTPDP